MMSVQFCDPHDICQWAAELDLPGGNLDPAPSTIPDEDLPPLRTNMAPTSNETDILRTLREAYWAIRPHGGLKDDTPENIRRAREHLYAYYRLIERVDALIGQVLTALDNSGRANDTLVVFASDHGEHMGAHGLVQKTFFYEESVHVPLIIRRPGATPGTCARLVNTGIDVLPTMLDYVGIDASHDNRLPHYVSRSLKPLVEGETVSNWRDHVVSEVHFCHNPNANPQLTWEQATYGRMVRTDRYSYSLYNKGANRELLFDIQNDPGENVNLAYKPGYGAVVAQHRAYLAEHARERPERYDGEPGDPRARDMLEGLPPVATSSTFFSIR
jgi:arylsulfatase A-like enzyme